MDVAELAKPSSSATPSHGDSPTGKVKRKRWAEEKKNRNHSKRKNISFSLKNIDTLVPVPGIDVKASEGRNSELINLLC